MTLSTYISLILVIVYTLTYINGLTVDGGAKTIYGRSPKLKLSIKGLDTTVDSAAINLTLYYVDDAGIQQYVRALRQYTITKDVEKGQGIILNLLDGQTWAKMDENRAPVSLWLSKISYGVDVNNPGPNQLASDPVIVARILKTPVVTSSISPKVIYQTTTPQLTINGTGLVGAKSLKLYFTPSLFVDIDYGIAETQFPLKKDSFKISLRPNGKWCPNPKDGQTYPVKLTLNGIDTGAGPVKVGGDAGVVIANVMPDKAGHKVTVTDTSETQTLYNDAPSLVVSGTSFNSEGTRLMFANGMSLNKNYTIAAITDTTMVLNLVSGMKWRANPMTLPAKLTVLQVDAGAGFVAVGPINSAKGRDVAKIYQRPTIVHNRNADGTEVAAPNLNQQQSHELWIWGQGFIPLSKSEYGTTELKFSPAIDPNAYTITCTARNKLVVSLKDGQKWGPIGELKVVAVKTKPSNGNRLLKPFDWVPVNDGKGQIVARIVADVGADKQGGITVIPSSVKVYASVRNDVIHVMGTGFAAGMQVSFFSSDFEDPKAYTIVQGTDFDLAVLSANELTLTLKTGKKWMEKGKSGGLFMKTVSPPGSASPFELAGGEGIRIAVVYADPVVEKAMDYDTVHESQSKVVTIWGSGFTTRSVTKVELRPTPTSNYKILSVDDDYIKVQLLDKKDWLPAFMHMEDTKEDKVSLTLTKIDTGAGLISMPGEGTIIGYIVKDRAGVTCDDSCEYAFDGVCDDNEAFYNWGDDDHYGAYSYYYGYYDLDDFNGQNVDDDYLSTAYSYQHEHDDYDFWNDDGNLGACLAGTDCTDCGGVDAEIDWNTVELGADDDYADDPCSNTCPYARDGVCDDPRGEDYCALGTDCQDCGVVGHSNFTAINDDVWWDDDDYWAFDDADFLDQTKGIDANRHRIASANQEEDEVSMFLLVLEGMVYAIGGAFVVLGGYIAYKMSTGNVSTVYQALALELTPEELEMVPSQRMAITPDVMRTQ